MIRVRIFNAHRKHRRRLNGAKLLALRVLKSERVNEGELNVVYIDDRAMIRMNGEYLGRRSTTDVLSFPLGAASKGTIEGEVYVNIDQAKRQAKEYDVSLGDELDRLIVHGILHLVGYDDATVPQRKRMTRRENTYLTISE